VSSAADLNNIIVVGMRADRVNVLQISDRAEMWRDTSVYEYVRISLLLLARSSTSVHCSSFKMVISSSTMIGPYNPQFLLLLNMLSKPQKSKIKIHAG
jgi:hypothetical protein